MAKIPYLRKAQSWLKSFAEQAVAEQRSGPVSVELMFERGKIVGLTGIIADPANDYEPTGPVKE